MAHFIRVFTLFLFFVHGITAQENTPIDPVQKETGPVDIALREPRPGAWDKATQGLDYSKDVPPQEKPKEAPKSRQLPNFNPDWHSLGNIFQVLVILLAVLGIGYGIYSMSQMPKNRQIARDGTLITAENLEDYLHESDLDRFLREALDKKNYSLCIRLYYLQIIKGLAQKNAINWSREKTNRDYLREMRQHPMFASFQSATKTYEEVWYGDTTLNADTFEQIAPSLSQLANMVK